MKDQIVPGLLLEKRWRVVEAIATGGFGQTFKVVDTDGTQKVLKVLNLDNFSGDEGKEKAISLFKKEAEVLNKLSHPGIPKVEKDAYFTYRQKGKLEPFHCLIMELVEGESLENWMEARKSQPISASLALDWLKQLAEVLKELHQQSYFHRDIKPSNIMLKPDGKLVLIDFGTVRENSLTYLGKIAKGNGVTKIDSPGYTSPEQWEGSAVPQSDFFALGRTFVYLLTGQHPLNFKDAKTGKLLWRKSAPQVSESLADLIDDLMAPFPGLRPQNATIILQRLTDIETGLPVPRRRYPQDSPRRTGAIAKVGIAALLLLGLTGLRLTAPEIATACNKRGVERHDRGELALAKFYYQCATLLQPDYGKAQYNLASLYEELEDLARARAGYRKAMEGGRAAAYNNFARLELLDNKCDEAIPVLREGLQLARRKAVKEALQANLGRAKLCQNLPWEAKSHLQEAIALGGDRSPARCLLAPVLDELGEKQGALSELEKCSSDAPNALPELDRWMREQTRRQLLKTETSSF
jgi:tetratricopeptide (TPR) repeat protein